MTRRATVRTATAPALRGQPVSLEGHVEYAGRSLLPVRPRFNVTLYGLTVLALRLVRRVYRWCWRWRDRTLPLALGALLDLLWWPTWAAAAVTLAVAPFTRRDYKTAARWFRQRFPRAAPRVQRVFFGARRSRDMAHTAKRWREICKATGVNPAPEVLTFDQDHTGLELVVQLTQETDPTKFLARRKAIGNAARATCHLADLGHGRWSVTLRTVDLLAHDPPFEPLDSISADVVPLGIDARGREVCARIFEANWLIGGSLGAGKSTAMNAMLASFVVIPGVQIWGIDAQEGVTLSPWRPHLARLATTPESAAALLEEWHAAMGLRVQHMVKVGCSLANPGPRWPLHILVIDELAQVVKQPDVKIAKAASAYLWRSLSLGRKAGFSVVAATQDPRADIIDSEIRSLFTHTLALRVRTGTDSDIVLGSGMRGAGWNAAETPSGQPGRGLWSTGDGVTPVRCYRLVPPFDIPTVAVSGRTAAESPGYTSSDQGVSRPTADSVRTADPLVVLVDAGNTRERCVAALVEAGPRGVEAQALADRWGLAVKTVRTQLVAADGVSKGGRYYRREDLP